MRLYRLSADQGNVNAQLNLGLSYEHGRGVDKREAVRLFRLAADQGDADAQSALENYYEFGECVAVDGTDQDGCIPR